MNTRLNTFILVIGLLVVVLSNAQAQAPVATPEDPAHKELRKLREGLLTAMNKGDLENFLAHLHTNCVITWHNAETSRGHAGVRAYFERVMTGSHKLVESFHCDVKVDELTILHGETSGVAYGSTDEHFQLAAGKALNIKGRWSATLVKEKDRWLVANLHASTNLFDNVLLYWAKRSVIIAAVVALMVGAGLGWLLARRKRAR